MYYKAEQRLKENEAQVAFQCGDFDKDDTYWKIDPKKTMNNLCQDHFCPDAFWKSESNQETDLHVVSVVRPRSNYKNEKGDVEPGHYVDVNVAATEKPIVLALIGQSLMQWNLKLDEKANVKEVLVMGSELVWVEGLPEDVKMTYFSKDQICAFPDSWKELSNPNNQFRRLSRALREYTKLDMTSFQGKQVAHQVRVPFKAPLLAQGQREIASAMKVNQLSLGVHWQRKDKRLVAESFQFVDKGERRKVEVPEKTSAGLYDSQSDKIFLINNYQFGHWDWKNKKFETVHVNLKMPALYWPIAMTLNEKKSEIYIYNDDRGGEIYSYNIKSKSWKLLKTDVGYSFAALTFDESKEQLIGTRVQGQKIVELVEINHESPDKVIALNKSVAFSKNSWRLQLVREPNELWLKVVHPAHPGGDIYPLSQSKM
ncbi:MAG: hypothetical protein HRT44_10350 [Bdellovibrionales bacterium]|nr:hypothetical protein [Bdellovibrionales bacterium]NQZ19640.1 hypothetical protein [Bdellovibrionales bacterium]